MTPKVVKSEQEWREQLTPERYQVLREAGTEPPFTGEYTYSKADGMFRCGACDAPLFSSDTKFDSGTGWPSFYEPVVADAVELHEDRSHGMVRTEVSCAACGSHLGHVFDDGPIPTGQRYCMNSLALKLDENGSDPLARGLRTFLPGAKTAPARPPEVGDVGPPLPGAGEPGRPRVIAFMRHVGCPFAEATARDMREAAAEAEAAVEWVVVTHSSPAVTMRWCAAVGCEGMRLVEDESRGLYASWGLGHSRLRHFMGWRSLRQVLRLRSEERIRNTSSDGTRWQKAGTFAVDAEGRVRWRHIPRHAGELPDFAAAVRALDLRDPLPR